MTEAKTDGKLQKVDFIQLNHGFVVKLCIFYNLKGMHGASYQKGVGFNHRNIEEHVMTTTGDLGSR